ncbi:MAG TPA: endonuclease/exonuclease/phosphatase family protein, partial [Patescibacteria group bacterium]|nr:endonuclease/exonuclease/phosphatase family protein [Patescibacteria group bacterium]
MKGALALLLFVSMVIGCQSVRQPQPMHESTFKVLSYNVNWGGVGSDEVAEIIRESDAEIVCLQETTPEWERFLKREFGADYSFARFRQSKG